MLNNDTLKKISACLAAVMIGTCGYSAFADGTMLRLASGGGGMSPVITHDTGNVESGEGDTANGDNTGGNTGETPGENPGGETDPPQPPAPTEIAVNISANYYKTEDNTYKIDFSSLDVIAPHKDFCFKLAFTDAEIQSYAFDSKMEDGSESVTKRGRSSLEFRNGSQNALLSGKLPLCTVTVTSSKAPAADGITLSDFTAVGEDVSQVIFVPALSVSEGPVVPPLNDSEKEVYDLITALPDPDTLSFYNEDNSLIDIAALKSNAANAADSYSALSVASQKNIDANLTYNMADKERLKTLPAIAEAMENVSGILSIAVLVNSVTDSNLLNYQFAFDTYNKVKDSVSASGIPNDSVLYSQYNEARTAISSKETDLSKTLSEASLNDRKNAVSKQLEQIQSMSTNMYYNDFLVCLANNADVLYNEIADSSEEYKNYMCDELKKDIDKIKVIQKGIAALPEVTFPKNVYLNSSYIIEVSRKRANAVDAKILVKAYIAKGSEENQVDSKSFNMSSGETEQKFRITTPRTAYSVTDNLRIDVYYVVEGAEFLAGSKTLKCIQGASSPSSNLGIPSGSSNSSQGSSSGGTRFPNVNDDDDNKPTSKPVENDNPLFSDIENYSWANEAIEGLYYAGIVNGMEEGIFNPAGNVTREQFCKMAVQLFGVLDNTAVEGNFADVDSNAWYAPYIYSAVRAGYIQGQSNEYFGVGESIMRQDMATILYRAMGTKNSSAVLNFTDTENIAPYAYDAISELVGLNIINGYEDGSFQPRGTATRAEAAKVIWGAYQHKD